MSNGFRFVLDRSGVNKLLRSAEMAEVIETFADEIKARAGEGYEKRTHVTEQRVITNIYADTDEAKQDNLENNTLLKSLKG